MPRTTSSPPARRKPRSPLNRDVILDAAIELIERDGPGALSMRRLGSRLGVEGMAIYHHFAGRDELLSAIGDRLLTPLHTLDPAGDWREACRRFATVLRELAVARPATFQLLGLQPFDTPTSLRPVEELLQVLVAAGFTPGTALGDLSRDRQLCPRLRPGRGDGVHRRRRAPGRSQATARVAEGCVPGPRRPSQGARRA